MLCLQDTQMANTTQYVVGYLLCILHGDRGLAPEHAGVGAAIHKDLRESITGVELGVTA